MIQEYDFDHDYKHDHHCDYEFDGMKEYLKFEANLQDRATVSAYDEVSLWSAMFGLLLLRYIPMTPNMRVLDIGCGTGFPLLELAQRLGPGCMVYGVDPWAAGLNRAREKMSTFGVKNVELLPVDAASIPYSDASFDLIVSNLGINNFENPESVLAECHRVLKREGKIALTTNLVGHMHEFYDVFESTLLEATDKRMMESFRAHVNHRATIEKAEMMFIRNGLHVTRVYRETSVMRFLDGTALLNHYFVKLGFLDGWKAILDVADQERVFGLLEANLNSVAEKRGALELTIPMAYIEGAPD